MAEMVPATKASAAGESAAPECSVVKRTLLVPFRAESVPFRAELVPFRAGFRQRSVRRIKRHVFGKIEAPLHVEVQCQDRCQHEALWDHASPSLSILLWYDPDTTIPAYRGCRLFARPTLPEIDTQFPCEIVSSCPPTAGSGRSSMLGPGTPYSLVSTSAGHDVNSLSVPALRTLLPLVSTSARYQTAR
eukprot:1464994-Rhodomonas_salina.1